MHHAHLVSLTLALAPGAALSACTQIAQAQRYDDLVAARAHDDYTLRVEGELLEACGLAGRRVYFDSDTSALTPDDRSTLGAVGRCLTEGRLARQSVLVTGHADAQGDAAHAAALGLARGRAVAMQLAAHGVDAQRIFVRASADRSESGSERALDQRVALRLLSHR